VCFPLTAGSSPPPAGHPPNDVTGVQARFVPKRQAEAPSALSEGKIELELLSEQRWVLPSLLVLVRFVFGEALCVRVTTTLTINPHSGKVVEQVRCCSTAGQMGVSAEQSSGRQLKRTRVG